MEFIKNRFSAVEFIDSTLQEKWTAYLQGDTLRLVARNQDYMNEAYSYAAHKIGYRFYSPKLTYVPHLTQDFSISSYDFPEAWEANLFLSYGHDNRFRGKNTLEGDIKNWHRATNTDDRSEPIGHAWGAMRDFAENNRPEYVRLFTGDELDISDPNSIELALDFIEFNIGRQRDRGVVNPYMVSLEPRDGSTVESEEYFSWLNEVAKSTSYHVSAYAYGHHRLPPSFTLEPNVLVGVTLGFNRSKYSYEELVAMWQGVADKVALRDYVCIPAWDSYLPGTAKVSDPYSFKWELEDYWDLGCRVYRGEMSAEWMKNLFGMQVLVQQLMGLDPDPDVVLNDMVNNIFDGDSRVADMYLYLATRPQTNNFMWSRLFSMVSSMEGQNPLYEDLRDAFLACYNRWKIDVKKINNMDTAERMLARGLLADVNALRGRDIIHSHAWCRQMANGAAKDTELWMYRKERIGEPAPDWLSSEDSESSSHGREAIFDITTKVLDYKTKVKEYSTNLTAQNAKRPSKQSPYILSRNDITLVSGGEARVHVDGKVVDFVDRLTVPAKSKVEPCNTPNGLAVLMHPENPPWLEPIHGGNAWLYHPGGDLVLDGSPRITVFTSLGRFDLTPKTRAASSPFSIIEDLPEQIVMVHGVNLRGRCSTYSAPPYLQLCQDVFVLPDDVKMHQGYLTKKLKSLFAK